MATTNKGIKAATAGAGVVGAVLVACAACCLPLAVPAFASLLAGASAYSIGDRANPWLIGGAAALMFAVAFTWMWTRRKSHATGTGTCGCLRSCKTASAPETSGKIQR